MAEHTPAPTPTRGVYGFALFLLFKTLFIIYVLWAFIPQTFLEETLGLTYLPDKYFALYIPILILVATTLFGFFIYPSLGLAMTLNINDSRTICDKYSKPNIYNSENKLEDYKLLDENITNVCDCLIKENCLVYKNANYLDVIINRKHIPTVSDLNISDVCRKLYLEDE